MDIEAKASGHELTLFADVWQRLDANAAPEEMLLTDDELMDRKPDNSKPSNRKPE